MNVAIKEVFTDAAVMFVLMLVCVAMTRGLLVFSKVADRFLEQRKAEAALRDDDISVRLFGTMQELVDSIVYNAVSAMEQTTAADLRKQVKAGLADRAELEKLAGKVLTEVRAQLEPDVEAILSMYIMDMDTYLKNQIESALLAVKKETAGKAESPAQQGS